MLHILLKILIVVSKKKKKNLLILNLKKFIRIKRLRQSVFNQF